MNDAELMRTSYPRLPDIIDDRILAEIGTLESKEKEFITHNGTACYRFFKALYLKAIVYLGHTQFIPGQLPQRLRLQIAGELNLSQDFIKIRRISPPEKSKIVAEIRQFIGLKKYKNTYRKSIEVWASKNSARKEGDIIPIINGVIKRFRDQHTPLPSFPTVVRIAESALLNANREIFKKINDKLSGKDKILLDLLLMRNGSMTPLDRLKAAVGSASVGSIIDELKRLKELDQYPTDLRFIDEIGRLKVDEFADMVKRYNAAQIKSIEVKKRRALLLCYLRVRQSQLLEASGELFVKTWQYVKKKAVTEANAYKQAQVKRQKEYEKTFGSLVKEKSLDDQTEVFWFLIVVQNAIAFWNSLAIEAAIKQAKKDGIVFTDQELSHILPILLSHINFVGRFFLDLKRQPPFLFAA